MDGPSKSAAIDKGMPRWPRTRALCLCGLIAAALSLLPTLGLCAFKADDAFVAAVQKLPPEGLRRLAQQLGQAGASQEAALAFLLKQDAKAYERLIAAAPNDQLLLEHTLDGLLSERPQWNDFDAAALLLVRFPPFRDSLIETLQARYPGLWPAIAGRLSAASLPIFQDIVTKAAAPEKLYANAMLTLPWFDMVRLFVDFPYADGIHEAFSRPVSPDRMARIRLLGRLALLHPNAAAEIVRLLKENEFELPGLALRDKRLFEIFTYSLFPPNGVKEIRFFAGRRPELLDAIAKTAWKWEPKQRQSILAQLYAEDAPLYEKLLSTSEDKQRFVDETLLGLNDPTLAARLRRAHPSVAVTEANAERLDRPRGRRGIDWLKRIHIGKRKRAGK